MIFSVQKLYSENILKQLHQQEAQEMQGSKQYYGKKTTYPFTAG